MNILEKTVLLGILAVLAWLDIKRREFPLPLLGMCGIGILVLIVATEGFSIKEMLGGVCVGGVLLVCALLSKERIGVGDALIFCITGICLGLWMNLFLLFLATAVCAVYGGALLAARKCTAKDSLPFAPFVLVSDVLILAMCV